MSKDKLQQEIDLIGKTLGAIIDHQASKYSVYSPEGNFWAGLSQQFWEIVNKIEQENNY